jgi:hypothetical protein
MSVKPVLLKDLRRDAIRNHQQNRGNGSYNSFSPLVARERANSVAKRQLDCDDSDTEIESENRKKSKVDRSAVFDQLKGQDVMLVELKDLIKANGSSEDPENTDPPNPIWKALGLMAKLHEGLLSAVIDWGGSNTTQTGGGSAEVQKRGSGSGAAKKLTYAAQAAAPAPEKIAPPPTPEETADKKLKQTLREAEKNWFFLIWISAKPLS